MHTFWGSIIVMSSCIVHYSLKTQISSCWTLHYITLPGQRLYSRCHGDRYAVTTWTAEQDCYMPLLAIHAHTSGKILVQSPSKCIRIRSFFNEQRPKCSLKVISGKQVEQLVELYTWNG